MPAPRSTRPTTPNRMVLLLVLAGVCFVLAGVSGGSSAWISWAFFAAAAVVIVAGVAVYLRGR